MRLHAEQLPLPVIIEPIAPYLGDGGIGLSWRDPTDSLIEAPAVFLSVTLQAGTTCIVFESDIFERQSHVPGYGPPSSAEIYPFLTEALTWWTQQQPLRPN